MCIQNPILNFRLLSTDKIQHQTPCLSTKKIHFLMNGGEIELLCIGAVIKTDKRHVLRNFNTAPHQLE